MTAATFTALAAVTAADECQFLAAGAAAIAADVIRMGRAAGVVVVTAASCPSARTVRPACPCPVHPHHDLLPLPGGAARGMCPVDGAGHQMDTPEVA
jgi:hypothetical protein